MDPVSTSSTGSRSGRASVLTGSTAMVLVGSSVAISSALTDAPLFTAQAARYAAATLLLLLLARAMRIRIVLPRGREWAWLAGIAATGLVLFNVAVVRGVAHAEPAVIAVAVACVPIVLGVVGPLLEGNRPARRILVAAAVVTAGGILVEGAGRTDATGVAWAVVALLCEAAFTLLAVPVLRRHGAWGVSIHAVWIATVLLVVLGLVVEGPGAAAQLDGGDWGAIVFLAVLVTAAAFVLWYSAVADLGAGRSGLLTGVAPVAAAVTGIAAGQGAPGVLVWLGIGVVLTGLALGLRAPATIPA